MIAPNIEERLITVIEKLKSWRKVRGDFLPVVYTDVVNDKKTIPTDFTDWKTFDAPYMLYENDKYYWFKTSLEINCKNEHERGYFVLSTNMDGRFMPSTIRPQGLLYVDGKLYQAVDINHTDILLENGKHEI